MTRALAVKLLIIACLIPLAAVPVFYHVRHGLRFRAPTRLDRLDALVPDTRGSWSALHLVSGRCHCSDSLLTYLETRRASAQFHEQILYLDAKPETSARLRAAGFQVIESSVQTLSERGFDLTGLPLFVARDPSGTARYAGGYTAGEITPFTQFNDVQIMSDLRSGRPTETKTIAGCAVSDEYRTLLDPLGVQYAAAPSQPARPTASMIIRNRASETDRSRTDDLP